MTTINNIVLEDESSPIWTYEEAIKNTESLRVERDSLWEMQIPSGAYWGIHTARALVNFPISRRAIYNYPELIIALAQLKQASARANKVLGVLHSEKADAIDKACQEIIEGKLHGEFVVGIVQGGAGTSTNMNANEVITNRALELLGHQKGEYQFLNPNDDTNKGQSTNDVYPTAIKLAMITSLQHLLTEHRLLVPSIHAKAREFEGIVKMGRTQLQDAVPMTVGQEFHSWGNALYEDQALLQTAIDSLKETNMGGTAIGTGITTEQGYRKTINTELSNILGYETRSAFDLIEATSDTGVFMSVSGALKRAAIKLSKICNDLRLLSSGPQTGFRELVLPAKQAGSSIMPGKVNPVIPEVVNQIAFSIMGADATVTAAVEAGQLQLNAFEPIIAHSILQSASWLRNGCYTLRVNCIDGIKVNEEHLKNQVANNAGIVTALTPYIGYSKAAEIAKKAIADEKPIRELILEAGLLNETKLDEVLSTDSLIGLK